MNDSLRGKIPPCLTTAVVQEYETTHSRILTYSREVDLAQNYISVFTYSGKFHPVCQAMFAEQELSAKAIRNMSSNYNLQKKLCTRDHA
ncbi:hypothetical protein BOTNAR_0228g00100 [Botryotinia narcissicola]|uniref:Uncharacterized protein n=1 Tax=Botryotinia narcissicola TaxID=278944 RepID=A0A4Z1I3Q0_9HELO|nr:hypothetical protein BOTNAR_0228g00100 [Botryotinia narcissicola]